MALFHLIAKFDSFLIFHLELMVWTGFWSSLQVEMALPLIL